MMDNIFKTIVAVIGATVTFLLGGWSPLLQVLITFIIMDYALAIMVAFTYGELNSKKGFVGIAKKVTIIVLVAVAHKIDLILGDGTFFRDAVAFFYIANELISILETASKTDLPIPTVLKRAVDKLNNKAGEDTDDTQTPSS